ncbi:class I SAM-dependent methyltransferase [Sunxiuqinia sp. A32]|uniref:class I SAM-dependent methyltransferase n=1 Tax=Sunxiuqinia sp. A32 TaxID=3461496 RepID=UPI004045B250
MNIFANEVVAQEYDAYYKSEQGMVIDSLEKQAILELVKQIARSTMLEIGCGTGHWTQVFAELNFEITATDVSDAMLAFAKNKNLPNTSFMKADVLNLPFEDHQFGAVSVITALEFCGNIEHAFSEINRVLKPGGWLIAGCLNAKSILGKTKEQDPVFKHGNFMTKAELKNHLSKFGNPTINECVHLSSEFEILDKTEKESSVPGAFIAATVQKIYACT